MTEEEKIKAMRLARAIASDISLYNEQKIIKGIEQDNLFEVLKEELEEGRELYKSRVSPEIFHEDEFLRARHQRHRPALQGAREVEDLVTPDAREHRAPPEARGERLDQYLARAFPDLHALAHPGPHRGRARSGRRQARQGRPAAAWWRAALPP